MKVVGVCGWSGSGKTTLVEQLIARLRLEGLRVSVIKHAHHGFDIDHPGKDSWRHRAAGAFEVVVASNRRLAKIREFAAPAEPTAHQLIAELYECDWVFVEGFKHADVPKIEVWRASTGEHRLPERANRSLGAKIADEHETTSPPSPRSPSWESTGRPTGWRPPG